MLYEETGQRFWLGADQLSRDTLGRLIYGARVSLYVSLISVRIGVTLGALIGIMSAYFGGVVDLILGDALRDVLDPKFEGERASGLRLEHSAPPGRREG